MKKSSKSKKNNKRLPEQRSISQMAMPLLRVPPPSNVPTRIRRTWTQDIAYYGNNGWFNSSQPDFQINFGASVSNINLGGVGVYGPSTPNASELAALYDQYRLLQVTVRIDWDYNSYPVSSGTAVAPLLYYVADYDDSTSALIPALLQYPGVQTHSFLENGYRPVIVRLKPKPLRDIASTGMLTGYGPMATAPWIRTTEMTVPHYGLKFCASQFSLGGNALIGSITITCYIDLEFANPK